MSNISAHNLKRLAYKFMLNNRAAALATVSKKGQPHVAIVYCVAHTDLSLYFSSRVEGRKYLNLIANPTVAMTFMNEADMRTIQLIGTAKRVDDIKGEQAVLHELLTYRGRAASLPLPPLELFERGDTNEVAIVKVTPLKMTFANFKKAKTGHYKPFFKKVI